MAGVLSPRGDDNCVEADYCGGCFSDEESEMEFWLSVACLSSWTTDHFGLCQGLTPPSMSVMSVLCLKAHAQMLCQSCEFGWKIRSLDLW